MITTTKPRNITRVGVDDYPPLSPRVQRLPKVYLVALPPPAGKTRLVLRSLVDDWERPWTKIVKAE